MGGFIKAECECGFKTEFMAGSGKDNFDEVCYAPAICPNCRELVVGNYMDKAPTCGKCNGAICFYNDPDMQEGSDNRPSDQAGKKDPIFILPSVKCRCPKCGQNEMRFKHIGCWA